MSHTPVAARITGLEDARAFVLGGNATFTTVSRRTSTRYTYRVKLGERGHLVGVLSGPDNEQSYTYVGLIRDTTFWFARGAETPAAKAFAWVWDAISNRDEHRLAQVEIWHAGRCSACGRLLTDPESIQRGLGPVCAERVGA